jgi:predicted DsbA family dithiol-disulfide isomerase
VKVEIWSDVVCPFCYIGKRQFEQALERFEHADEVEIEWRSFELDPNAPQERLGSQVEHLAAKYGMSRADAQAAQDRVLASAARVDLHLDFERARPGNTFDAHRLVHLAADHGLQGEMEERLFSAYFVRGEAIGDPAALAAAAVEVGVPAEAVDRVLGSDEYAAAVRADEDEARGLGITGVPFFVVDRAYGVSGAQGAEALLEVLDRAWVDRPAVPVATGAPDAGRTDAACGDDTCAV